MLELGGKSGLVVFGDVDVDDAVRTTMKGFLTNAGQICTAHTRLIVHESIKDALLQKLKVELEQLRERISFQFHGRPLALAILEPKPNDPTTSSRSFGRRVGCTTRAHMAVGMPAPRLSSAAFVDDPIGATDRGDRAWEDGKPECTAPSTSFWDQNSRISQLHTTRRAPCNMLSFVPMPIGR